MAYNINVYEYEDGSTSVEVFNTAFVYPQLVNTLNVTAENKDAVEVLITSYRELGKVNLNYYRVSYE